MKIVTLAALVLALIAMPAQAQVNSKRSQPENPKRPDEPLPVDEKAYKAAVERIPESKEKYDPWGVARPKEIAKEIAKETAKETAKKPKP